MLKAEVDMAELERSLKKAAAKFGDTNEQMLYRWGVQCAREAAIETQPYGGRTGKQGTAAKKKSRNSIEQGLYAICIPLKGVRRFKSGKTVEGITMDGKRIRFPVSRFYDSPDKLDQFWQSRRNQRYKRTRRSDIESKAAAPFKVFKATLKKRLAHAGMAKSGWIQAGQMIAARQQGAERIRIGKGFLSYAQKIKGKGRISLSKGDGFSPAAWIHNLSNHTKSTHVMKPNRVQGRVIWAAKNTLKWYHSAIRRSIK